MDKQGRQTVTLGRFELHYQIDGEREAWTVYERSAERLRAIAICPLRSDGLRIAHALAELEKPK